MGINAFNSSSGGVQNINHIVQPSSLGELLNVPPQTTHSAIVGQIFSHLKNDVRSVRALACVSKNLNYHFKLLGYNSKSVEILSPELQQLIQTMVAQTVQTVFTAEKEKMFFSPQMQQAITACVAQGVQSQISSEKDKINQMQNDLILKLAESQKKQATEAARLAKEKAELETRLAGETNRRIALERQANASQFQIQPIVAAAVAQNNATPPFGTRVLAAIKNGGVTVLKFIGRNAKGIQAGVMLVAAILAIAFIEFAPIIALAAGALYALLEWISQRFN